MKSKRSAARNAGGRVLVLLYTIVFLMIGLLLVLFRMSGAKTTDCRERSRAFNGSLTAIFEKQGVTDVAGPFVTERKGSGKLWLEFSRSVEMPATADPVAIILQLREAAKAAGITLAISGPARDAFTAHADREGMRFAIIEARVRRSTEAAAATSPGMKRVAIVIDDIGYSADLSAYLGLGIPITFAILPHERHTGDVVRELRDRHMPYILHLPLEPEKYPTVDPGKAALLLAMTDDGTRKKFASDVASVPGACGVSNHMGSAFSENEAKMRLLLELVKERGLFYFDSVTTPKTRASRAARSVGLPFAENGLFLDLQDDPAFMKKQCEILRKRVLRAGKGIAIGHIQKKFMIPVLKEIIPAFKQAGIEFAYLKDLVQVLPPEAEATLAKKHRISTHEHTRH